MINIKNLNFSYNENNKVINNLNLNINKSEFIAILGHNGSGKSTLSKLLNGLLVKESGDIIIDGIELNKDTVFEIRKKIGIIFQNPDSQFVNSTVKDEIAFGLENLSVERDEMIKLIDKYSKEVFMHKYLDVEPYNLSGGQKQRVAIASILAMNTDIIIFDEATSMLDPKGKKDIIKLIKELNSLNKTIIMITHDLEEAKLADKVFVMNKGDVILEGTPKEVFSEYKLLKEIDLDIPMSLNIMNKIKNKDKRLSKLLWEYSLKK